MVTKEIFLYIQSERAKNTPDEVIKSSLIANGWSEKDVVAALSQASLVQPVLDAKAEKGKMLWTTFFSLLAVDLLLVLGIRFFYGRWGLFGISLISILVRVLVIYLISSFSVHGSTVGDKNIVNSIFRVIATVIVVITIAVGIFFIYCLYVVRL